MAECLWRCPLCQPDIPVWRASGAATSQCVKAHWPGLEIGSGPVSLRTVQSHPATIRPFVKLERLPARRLLEFITRKGRRTCNANFGRKSKLIWMFSTRCGGHAKTCQMGAARDSDIY